MNINLQITIPHIKYVSVSHSIFQQKNKELYYLGGEPSENDSRLTIGKKYHISQASYAEHKGDQRVTVWVCGDDENKGKLCRLQNISRYGNILNFGEKWEIRDKKLNEIGI